MSKKRNTILIFSVFSIMIVCLLFNYAFGDDIEHTYNIVFNYNTNDGLFEDKAITITSIDGYVDGKKLEGLFRDSASCVTGSKMSTSCDIIQIVQNEKIISQNEEIISLLKELKK